MYEGVYATWLPLKVIVLGVEPKRRSWSARIISPIAEFYKKPKLTVVEVFSCLMNDNMVFWVLFYINRSFFLYEIFSAVMELPGKYLFFPSIMA